MSAVVGGERWTLRNYAHLPIHDVFIKEYGSLLGSYFSSRSFESLEQAQSFLNPRLSSLPSPSVLKNLTESAKLLASHIRENKKILVYGDYDVDGMSGLSLAADFFDRIGYSHYELFIPHRFDEGYGVHVSSLKRIRESFEYDLVLTVDSGIGAIEPAKYLKSINVAFVITDHHLPANELPCTPYIVNPNQGTCESGLGHLCGTAVMFFMLAGLKSELGVDIKFDVFLDLVSLATVADQMELRDINRALVKEGLRRWPSQVRPAFQYMATLMKSYEARDLAFSVAPKLNAASRMGQAMKALAFLRSQTIEEAQAQYTEVEALNTSRVESQAIVMKEATEQASVQIEEGRSLLLIQGEEWLEGVLGIVAAKLVESFNLPAIVLSKTPHGTLRGSMRCPTGFHCVSFLEGARAILKKFGGHAEAAGMEIETAKISAFEAYIKSVDFSELSLHRVVEFDGEVEVLPTLQEVEALNRSAPWGRGNAQPLFLYSQLPLSARKVLKEKHVKWDLVGGSAIAFGFEELCKKLEELGHRQVDALVVPEISEFRGRKSTQLRVTRIRPSENP
ncbi:MAG: single-stranded-DNA-specific exonuclease RecJ [Bdellovibrionota bacterium]